MSRNKYPEETKKLILGVSLKLFLEKGYENTSIQDIIDNLGGLSKGAIYHHFKSKEEIFESVAKKIICDGLDKLLYIRDEKKLTGHEKLKRLYKESFNSSYQEILFKVSPDLIKNSRLLALHIDAIFKDIAPNYIEPIIREGIKDGSIVTDYPKELAEVMVVLTNIWLNPMVVKSNREEIVRKTKFFNYLLRKMNIDLIDDQMIEKYFEYIDYAKKIDK